MVDENAPRNQWPLAKVTEATPSNDKLVRKIKIQIGSRNLTKTGKRKQEPTILERPIQKVVLIQPTEQEAEDTQ